MGRRYGGKYSPDSQPSSDGEAAARPRARPQVDAAGARVTAMFVPPVLALVTTFGGGARSLAAGLAGAGLLALGAWMLREGIRAEAAYHDRKVAQRPALPRKILAACLAGFGTAAAAYAHADSAADLLTPLIFGVCASALHIAAFGIDPLASKGMEGIDTFQRDRVARVVGEAETLLTSMTEAIRQAGDRRAEEHLADFQATARELIRTVEEDPRDLTAARKYLVVYLRGARDATRKFAELYKRNHDQQARADYIALLDDLDQNFAARTRKSLLDDRSDLTIEIDVLRERLSREGVRLE